MNGHEDLKQLLPLAAADVLSVEETLALQRHTQICPECRQELELLTALARDCANAPVAAPPPWLMQRTLARVRQLQSDREELRSQIFLSVILGLAAWTTTFAGCWILHRVTGAGWLPSAVAITLFSALCALCAAWILGSDLNTLRREK